MASRGSAHAQLHAIVVLWGFTAILGREISIQALPLVFYRIGIVVVALAILVPARGIPLRVPVRAALRYAVIGALIGGHWLCFYGAIKVAGVPVAVLSLSTIAFFTAILEPIAFRRPVHAGELAIGAVVVVGVALLGELELDVTPLGLALGLGSALLSSAFGVANGKLTLHERPERLMLYEMAAGLVTVGACFAFAPSQLVAPWALSGADLGWLIVLALACTVLPQVWVLHVLRVLSPFTVAVSTNLEPVYALILAAVIFPEDAPPTVRFYVGAAILLGLVIVNGARRARR